MGTISTPPHIGVHEPYDEDIVHRFTNHPPETPFIGELFDDLTLMFIHTGCLLKSVIPPGREQSLALMKLEEASMWTKAGIARNQADVQ